MRPCPDCGEREGGRYNADGVLVCWPCWMRRTGLGPLPPYSAPPADPEWILFRKRIIDALWAVDRSRFVYLDRNTTLGACPCCLDGYVRVEFHGRAARADLSCSLGCPETDIANRIANRTTGTIQRAA